MHPQFLTVLISILSGSFRIFKFILSLITTIVLFSTISFIIIYFYFARGLPDIRSLEDYKPPVLSQVLADDGTEIGEFWTECRIFLPYEKIPKRIVQAFVASEDSRFWEHKGVDMRSIARAFFANLRAGEITQGGSTITQQITRSILLTPERKLSRKIKEAILATRIERKLDKEQIITLYLNQIFLGNRAYGVAAAGRNYFHKDVNDLSLAEIGVIAGMPSAPAFFSPLNHPEEARLRQLHVLNRMYEEGIISKDEMKKALNEKLTIYTAGTDKEFAPPETAYFVEHVRRLVKDKYGDDVLYHKGLKIYSTMNMAMQRAAYKALRHGVEKIDRRQGWRGPIGHIEPSQIAQNAETFAKEILQKQTHGVVTYPLQKDVQPESTIVFEPETSYAAIVTGFSDKDTQVIAGNVTGVIPRKQLKWARPFENNRSNYDDGDFISDPRKILKVGDIVLVRRLENGDFSLFQEPMIQGALFSMDPHTAGVKAMIGGYDFAKSEFNRATQALRQPGSSFKPIVYAAALDKGYTYNTTIMDSPITFTVGREVWTPKNYGGGYKGATPFRNCLIFSRNVPTVKIVADIGTHYLTAYARKMGLTSPIEKYLSMALGANGVYLSEVVPAFATFLNEGVYKTPIYITRIEDAQGNVLEEHKAQQAKRKVVQQETEPQEGGQTESEQKEVEQQEAVQQDEEKNEYALKPRSANEVELRSDLFTQGQEWITKDKLVLNDIDLKILYGNEIPEGHIITPQTAYLMVNLMKGVVEGGTGTRVKALGKPAGGKTGTTNDETDTWFNGFVPDLSAGVWIGFDEIMPIGRGETGGRTAAPIFLEYMQEATKGWEAKDFKPPTGFPVERIATLAGGSAVVGARVGLEVFGERGGVDRAGEFFEEDMESYSRGEAPSEAPTPRQPREPGENKGSRGSSDEFGY